MKDLNVKLEVFEGPLDLLLHLIKTLEIDIYDIPISEITEQYMIYINTMKELDLELAGEYIVMAATLMSIKSKMLLPQEVIEIDTESEYALDDPRDELVRQLIDYRTFKYAATVLEEKEAGRSDYFTKEPSDLSEYELEFIPLKDNEITTIDLFLAINDILARKKEETPMETNIQLEEYTVPQKITELMERIDYLGIDESLSFESLFLTFSRSEIVTTFLALLELMRSKKVIVKQATYKKQILIYKKEG